ncbi:hypothetical protein P152DRAFT_483336 [Eremomyces bilateralis CBS 781.70]|uniref:Protein NO VEIN C-terminal domain-containing protein n=1 Tax=Eremomyces bilateralis CBS 781.70 TaxID=1392243 RepID=A0A6G1FYZ1_9PEZI|nr:uncharacterized protein P152DRAFT_483336 [Eremomyces bilateralis CBS 781.70]KAF1811004.1 hypothetical protein P152DRAFT_483336 [Eremomyces bilateralis CBS 781.70]
MTIPISKERGREVVAEMRRKNGGMSQKLTEKLHLLEKDDESELLGIISGLRGQLGASLSSLTDNLNSEDTRFIYELIQNAEDTKFDVALSKGETPFLSFDILPKHVIVDSNEDGFTEEDVRAICDINKSTKAGQQQKERRGYIGEKGIGFKSVFRVASRVHIQSVNLSFSFKRPSVDLRDSMGMITPMDEDFLPLPPSVRTRMVLTLTNPASIKESVKDLFDLQGTMMLFFNKLKQLKVNDHLDSDSITTTSYTYNKGGLNDERGQIKKQVQRNCDDPEISISYFRVFEKDVSGLPEHQLRKTRSAPVALAFPVTAKDEPIVVPQMTYAYLPLRKANFNFLIQSDFVTSINREDVDHSERNKALLTEIGSLFAVAVLEFCRHKTLRYSWPLWLPYDAVPSDFWSIAKDRIVETLKSTRILFSRSNNDLFLPTSLRKPGSDSVDKFGNPLFRDILPEIYISKAYEGNPLGRLYEVLGLKTENITEFLDRVSADLQEQDSLWKSSTTSDEWQSRASVALKEFLKKFAPGIQRKIRQLKLIPLTSNRWIAADDVDSSVYFDRTDGVPIPNDLGLCLVPNSMTQNIARQELFEKLGVQPCTPSLVIQKIDDRYREYWLKSPFGRQIELADAVSHIGYLFQKSPPEDSIANHDIGLFGNSSLVRLCGTEKSNLYFRNPRDQDEYGPSSLLRDDKDEPVRLRNHTELKAEFLDDAYFSAAGEHERNDGNTFRSWLQVWAGVRSSIPLLDDTGTSLSVEAEYVRQRQPDKFVGFLKRSWRASGLDDKMFFAARKSLRQIDVLTQKGFTELRKAYLPTPEMIEFAEKLQISDFPFLQLPQKLDLLNQDDWTFLRHVGVVVTSTRQFYQQCLLEVKAQTEGPGTAASACTVYQALSSCCNSTTELESIRKWLRENEGIYFRQAFNMKLSVSKWQSHDSCIWDGPSWETYASVLKSVPEYTGLQDFFRVTLKIRDICLEDALKELQWRSCGKGVAAVVEIKAIYHYIWRQVEHDSNGAPSIKAAFEKEKMIFNCPSGSWLSASDAIWADATLQIPDKVSIAAQYPELKDFFLGILKVQKPDLQMHIDALKALGGDLSRYADIKRSIIQISLMDPTKDDLDKFGRAQVFPVLTKDKQMRLADKDAGFFILDRKEHISAFEDRLNKLDFSLAEIQKAGAFLDAAGLSGRYSSACVDESTTAEGGCRSVRLTGSFNEKAYFMTCCALHFGSAKFGSDETGLYDLFRSTSIYTSGGISTSITLTQYDITHRVPLPSAKFHLEHRNGRLDLYVPRRRSDQEVCFKQQLPSSIFRFLLCRNSRAEKVLGDIIQSSCVSVADRIITNAGVAELEGLDKPDVDDDDDDDAEDDYDGSEENSPDSNQHRTSSVQGGVFMPAVSDTAPNSAPSQPASPSRDRLRSTSDAYDAPALSRTSSSEEIVERDRIHISPEIPDRDSTSQMAPYTELLKHIVEAAARTALPNIGESVFSEPADPTALWTNLNTEAVFGPRLLDRDNMIGAAGELFVFEFLCSRLQDFGKLNWPSTIRKYIRVHPSHTTLEPWKGTETADLVYEDSSGRLRELLVNAGYDCPSKPSTKFLLEVKTTTKDCSEPFFMKSGQYNLMQRAHSSLLSDTPEVYVLCRVFGISSRRIGWRLFLDPEAARETGELQFSTHSWKVASR